jgi:hypothetical protein
MKILMLWIKQLRCAHIYRHHRNIHGDEINHCGGKRSVWVCVRCDKREWRDELFYQKEQQ